MPRHRGQHRKPTTTAGGTIARTAAHTAMAGAVAGTPLVVAAPAAQAAADSTWDKVAQCESGGHWSTNTGNGYSGGLQFARQTWRGFGGAEFAPDAYRATRAEQIVVAERVLAEQGWGAWPVCSRKAAATGQGAAQRSAPAAAEPAAEPAVAKPTAAKPAVAAKSPAPAEPARKEMRLSEPAAASGGNYVVRPGDSLSRVAAANGVAGGWQELVAKNPALAANPNLIYPGQTIAT